MSLVFNKQVVFNMFLLFSQAQIYWWGLSVKERHIADLKAGVSFRRSKHSAGTNFISWLLWIWILTGRGVLALDGRIRGNKNRVLLRVRIPNRLAMHQ